jgi:hypothetical protein
LLLAFQDFLLERVGLRELEADFVGGELVVDLSHSIKLVLNLLSIEGIDEDSHVFLSVEGNSG